MKGLWIPVSGQIAQQAKIDTIANNVANINTHGFKKDNVVFKEYLAEFESPQNDIDIPKSDMSVEDMYRTSNSERSKVSLHGSYTQHSQGPVEVTNRALDLAIEGEGFIAVQTPRGVRFTRNGALTLNNDGFLTTNQGYLVLSEQDLKNMTTPASQVSGLNFKEQNKFSINDNGEVF